MPITLFNIVGVLATLSVMAPTFFAAIYLGQQQGWTPPDVVAFWFITGTLPLSIIGLVYDRRDADSLVRGYWDNYREVIYDAFDNVPPGLPDNAARRTALFVVPLAVSPYCVLAGCLFAYINHAWEGQPGNFGWYTLFSAGACVLTTVLAVVLSSMGFGRC